MNLAGGKLGIWSSANGIAHEAAVAGMFLGEVLGPQGVRDVFLLVKDKSEWG